MPLSNLSNVLSSNRFNLRVVAGTLSCATLAIAGLVSPAIAQDRTVWLQDNETTTITGYFLQGEEVYASCDEDCADLNLFLFNEMGAMVAADDAVDAFPVVTAPYDGTFSIEVSMPTCTHGAGCSASISSDFGF